MQILHDNLNEDSASTFSTVFSSNSSSFRSSTDTDSDGDRADVDVFQEPLPTTPTTAAEANALFEHIINAPGGPPKRPHARRVSFATAREPSLNHDVEEVTSLTQSAVEAPLEVEPVSAPAPEEEAEPMPSGVFALPTLAATEALAPGPRSAEVLNASMSSMGLGAVEQAPVNSAQASSAKSTASLLSAKTLAEYRHLKYVLRQRLLRRYYDLWRCWVSGSPTRKSPSSAMGQASVSTQTLSVDHDFLRRRGVMFKDPMAHDLDWNADVESIETVSLVGSSVGRQSLSLTPRASASRGSSPGAVSTTGGVDCTGTATGTGTGTGDVGGGAFSYPEPLPEPACLGATSRPARLVDFGARSDCPRPKGPQSLSGPSTGLPSVVEHPLRVTYLHD